MGMDDTMTDLHRLRPLNMYGYSKHLFDLHAQRTGMAQRIVGMKYFNVYGPNEDHKADMRSVVHKAYGQILQTGKVQLFKSDRPDYKDGEQMRDFLYVKDAIKMTLHLASDPQVGGLYNLGSGEANTWVQLVTAIFAALGKEPNIEFVPMPEHLKAMHAALESRPRGPRPTLESISTLLGGFSSASDGTGDDAGSPRRERRGRRG